MKPCKYWRFSRISHISPWAVFPCLYLVSASASDIPSQTLDPRLDLSCNTVPALSLLPCFSGSSEEVCSGDHFPYTLTDRFCCTSGMRGGMQMHESCTTTSHERDLFCHQLEHRLNITQVCQERRGIFWQVITHILWRNKQTISQHTTTKKLESNSTVRIRRYAQPYSPDPTTSHERAVGEKWEHNLALTSELIDLGQSERPNSYEQISKGKSTLRKHLVFNWTDKCDNTTVRKGLEGFFPIHLS